MLKSLDLRTSELNQCKVTMEEKQPMFNNLISIKRITLDRSKSRVGRSDQSPSKSSLEGTQQSRDGKLAGTAYGPAGVRFSRLARYNSNQREINVKLRLG